MNKKVMMVIMITMITMMMNVRDGAAVHALPRLVKLRVQAGKRKTTVTYSPPCKGEKKKKRKKNAECRRGIADRPV